MPMRRMTDAEAIVCDRGGSGVLEHIASPHRAAFTSKKSVCLHARACPGPGEQSLALNVRLGWTGYRRQEPRCRLRPHGARFVSGDIPRVKSKSYSVRRGNMNCGKRSSGRHRHVPSAATSNGSPVLHGADPRLVTTYPGMQSRPSALDEGEGLQVQAVE